ncbi:hypothetical protein EVAR_89630_1 [Eumeta japonica]|uniref:Uncharacterized protein n=1 Tax=Eumeta variegata TaxID=151549 RepID=A0A4C1T874_EUMVA|nr:hypothetical protein EVAR_89630_1 [Eumeta japonica]
MDQRILTVSCMLSTVGFTAQKKQIYEIINDLEEIPDHESMQTGNNVEDEDGDSLEDVEDQPEKPLESDDEEIPSKDGNINK